jgi:hypothetical protein
VANKDKQGEGSGREQWQQAATTFWFWSSIGPFFYLVRWVFVLPFSSKPLSRSFWRRKNDVKLKFMDYLQYVVLYVVVQ